MERRVDLDYCPACDLPTFCHEQVVPVRDEFMHRHCFEGSVMVAKRSALTAFPLQTN